LAEERAEVKSWHGRDARGVREGGHCFQAWNLFRRQCSVNAKHKKQGNGSREGYRLLTTMERKSLPRKLLINLALLAGCAACMGLFIHSRNQHTTATLALAAALSKNDIKLARKWVEQGADVNIHENPPKLPQPQGVFNRMKLLLWPPHQGYGTGKTALILAAGYEDLDFVKLLLKRGADVTAESDDPGWKSPLIAAASTSSIDERYPLDEAALKRIRALPVYDVLKVLLERGAKVGPPADAQLMVLDSIRHFCDTKCENLLIRYLPKTRIDNPAVFDTFMYSTQDGRIEIVRALLDRGANPNYVDFPRGYTYLMGAAGGGHIRITRLLLDRGADVNIEDVGFFDTALMGAVRNKRDATLVKLLLDHGANIQYKDKKGDSILDRALSVHSQKATIALLRKAGAKTIKHPESWYKDHPPSITDP
jgi:ankyrin repeat protein